ncbi:sigma factor-like helix-turn-helix DNA-binding protein [Streptomyces sannanensis]
MTSPLPSAEGRRSLRVRAATPGSPGYAEAPRIPAAPGDPETTGVTPAMAFDELYALTATALLHQAFLLTGRRQLAQKAVRHAFDRAWQRWPEVATDRDPAGWVRIAVHEYALSPWHRMRRTHRQPDPPPEEPALRALQEALLELPASYRRTLLLYDGLGLDLPETAAETEASTPAAASRLLNARAAIALRLPELADAATPAEQSGLLRERLGDLVSAGSAVTLPSAESVRMLSERWTRIWTRAAIMFATVITGATACTLVTAPTQYIPRVHPGEPIPGVPALAGPQAITTGKQLRDKLRSAPGSGPERLVPQWR